MNELEIDIIKSYKSLHSDLIKWGVMVDSYIIEILSKVQEVKNHIKIPPQYRLKDDISYLSKAIYRNKGYANHLLDIEDKIGTRIVLLKSNDVTKVSEILLNTSYWQIKKTKDIFDFVPENAKMFDYQSIHLVCNPSIDSCDFPTEHIPFLSCEIQIRTLLQHAFAEISHDSTYKGVYRNDVGIIRKLARSMALMEATDEYFCDIFELMSDETRYYSNFLKELIILYKKFVQSFDINSLDKKLTDLIFELLPIMNLDIDTIISFTKNNTSDISMLLKNSNSYITKQPVVILISYCIINKPNSLREHWPLSQSILENLFVSLGYSFDNY